MWRGQVVQPDSEEGAHCLSVASLRAAEVVKRRRAPEGPRHGHHGFGSFSRKKRTSAAGTNPRHKKISRMRRFIFFGNKSSFPLGSSHGSRPGRISSDGLNLKDAWLPDLIPLPDFVLSSHRTRGVTGAEHPQCVEHPRWHLCCAFHVVMPRIVHPIRPLGARQQQSR